MENIKLIIQKNNRQWSEVVFWKRIGGKRRIRESLKDERSIAQVAHESDCYSIITYKCLITNKSFNVYSYINSNANDIANRKGIVTFRLYLEVGKKILKTKEVFARISENLKIT